MLNSLLFRPKDELAIIYKQNSYLVKDILQKADKIGEKLNYLKHCTHPRVLLPVKDPVLFLASLFACWQHHFVAIPQRHDSDEALTNTYAQYLPNATIHPVESTDFEVAIHNQSPTQQAYYGDVFLTTSGSTGKPKGVVLTVEQLLLNAFLTGRAIGLTKNDIWGTETNLALTSGLCHLLMAWIAGIPLHFLRNASVAEKNNFFMLKNAGYGGAPIQGFRLADEIEEGISPKNLMVSGDFLTDAMLSKIRNRFPKTHIHKVYGLTEVSGRFCIMPSHLIDQQNKAVGAPLPGFSVEVRNENGNICSINEPGMIYLRSPLVMQGYIIDGIFQAHGANEWFCTNDIGYINDVNLLCLQGRANDSFKVGGEKVDRFTIEEALSPLLANYEYCVLPIPHELLGFCPALFVANNEQLPVLRWKNILNHLSKQLPPRYIPMQGFHLPSLSRKSNGKLDIEKILATTAEPLPW